MQKWTTPIANASDVITQLTEDTNVIVVGSLKEVHVFNFELTDFLLKHTDLNEISIFTEPTDNYRFLPKTRTHGLYKFGSGVEKNNGLYLKLQDVSEFYLADIAKSLRALGTSRNNHIDDLELLNSTDNEIHIWLDLSQITDLVEVGTKLFADCSSLEKIVFPDTLQKLGSAVFSGCNSLSDVQFSGSMFQWKYEVEKTRGWLNGFPVSEIHCADGNVEVPVIEVNGKVLNGCRCNYETEIVIPHGVEEIHGTFSSCKALKSLVIPSSVKEIDYGALLEILSGSVNIHFKGTVEDWNNIKTDINGVTICIKDCPMKRENVKCSDGIVFDE